MDQHHTSTSEYHNESPVLANKATNHPNKNERLPRSAALLERADTLIYTIVGICFLIGALVTLIYAFWGFGTQIAGVLNNRAGVDIAQAIIQFVSDLLLVLIIMEVLGTITHYLKSQATSLRPFLFIGIISATRSILSVGAKLSIVGSRNQPSDDFLHAMIELGVSAAVVLALGITLKLLGRDIDDNATGK
jgi:uncharacterized membrane protein (DUF373 family)